MKTVALIGLVLLSTPAFGQATGEAKKSAKYDPNRMICRTESSTGSRVSSQKRCLTAQQWADQKLIDRQVVERAQGGGWKNGGGQ